MADGSTTSYSFTLPEVGASEDSWGTKLNANWSLCDDLLDGTTGISPNLLTLKVGGTVVNSTAAELNIMDGGTAATSTTLVDADRVVVNDDGTMVQVALTDFGTYFKTDVTTLGTIEASKAVTADSSGEVQMPDDKKLYFGSDDDAHIMYDETTDDRLEIGGAEVYVDDTLTAKRGIGATLTDTSNTGSITLDFSTSQNFVLTLTGNVTLANPTTEAVGQSGFLVLIQDSTGGRTVSLGTDYETAAGAGLTLSSTASTTDIVPYIVAASGRILLGAPQLAFS